MIMVWTHDAQNDEFVLWWFLTLWWFFGVISIVLMRMTHKYMCVCDDVKGSDAIDMSHLFIGVVIFCLPLQPIFTLEIVFRYFADCQVVRLFVIRNAMINSWTHLCKLYVAQMFSWKLKLELQTNIWINKCQFLVPSIKRFVYSTISTSFQIQTTRRFSVYSTEIHII